jgi:hypothetical protein
MFKLVRNTILVEIKLVAKAHIVGIGYYVFFLLNQPVA